MKSLKNKNKKNKLVKLKIMPLTCLMFSICASKVSWSSSCLRHFLQSNEECCSMGDEGVRSWDIISERAVLKLT